jgi:hypothetical protein
LHLQILSVVAAKLASYLMMLRARDAESQRARELEEARRLDLRPIEPAKSIEATRPPATRL